LEIGVAGSVAKKVWRKPTLKVMTAGAAEKGGPNNRQDGNGNGNFS
jgi:hypothetical protein